MAKRSQTTDVSQTDLFAEEVVLSLPPRFSIKGRVLGSPVEQLLVGRRKVRCRLEPFRRRGMGGFSAKLPTGECLRIVDRKTTASFGDDLVLIVPQASSSRDIAKALAADEGSWLSPVPLEPSGLSFSQMNTHLQAVLTSWEGAFQIREGSPPVGSTQPKTGLRRPQVGAVHAALAHATRSVAPATVVMPTGTGKTETMLALQVAQKIERLLVVVPTDTLRDQIAGKFQSLGILKDQDCLNRSAAYPVVARLSHIPHTPAEVDEVFQRSNVVVTTMHIAGRSTAEVQERMADWASALFIDEAHHIGARTWAGFRALFADHTPAVPITQFTATPFREDGRRVDGEFIYTYPLRKAQAEGYFKQIRFDAVFGLDQEEADLAIVEKLGNILRADLEAGRNHLAIARCQTIERADKLHRLYAKLLPEYQPVVVHSHQPIAERRSNLLKLRKCESRIVVCVDMLGEGFDLPELKIAALHDHHKSVAVTIQFVGRLTRPDPTLGDATVIANTGMDDVDRSLAKLYAEDADWNYLVEALSSANIERQVRRAEMFKGFVGSLTDIPLQTLEPKMNAVVYSTRCSSWDPHRAEDLYATGTYLGMKVNQHQRIAIFVTRSEDQAPWTTVAHAQNVSWDLYMMHWDESRELLYISGSSKGTFDELAKLVCGDSARRVQGEDVFRCFHGFSRLILRNLGLTHRQGRGIRFSMYMGVDIAEGLDNAKSQARIKNNVFGAGFLHGRPASLGCSAKGKFWSLLPVRDLTDWVDWCHEIGKTVIDPGIATDGIFRSAMRPHLIHSRPAIPPVAIHWPESLIWQLEDRVEISFGGRASSFFECDIALASNSRDGPLTFTVQSAAEIATFEVVIDQGAAYYPQRAGPKAIIKIGNKALPLSDFFADDAPHIDFGDGSLLIYCHLYSLPDGKMLSAYPAEKIEAWDWSNINIRAESQGLEKRSDSIQRLVIERLLAEEAPYDVIFDDDGSGEIADVVGMRIGESIVHIDLFHCKYSAGEQPGARVKDLYEVCGQAQKSARWRDRPNRMLQHMLRREKLRLDRVHPSRFECGTPAVIKKLKAVWQEYRYEYQVRIVQPGLSREAVGEEGLHLLASTETYLLETRAMPLQIIGSR